MIFFNFNTISKSFLLNINILMENIDQEYFDNLK